MSLMLEEFTNSSKWCYGCCFSCNTDQASDPPSDITLIGEVINWLTDYQLPTLYQDKSSKIFPIREFFFLAVLDNRMKTGESALEEPGRRLHRNSIDGELDLEVRRSETGKS